MAPMQEAFLVLVAGLMVRYYLQMVAQADAVEGLKELMKLVHQPLRELVLDYGCVVEFLM